MMESGVLSSLDPDSYECVYICQICNGISTEPVCSNEHITDVTLDHKSIDYENLIKPTMLNKDRVHVTQENSVLKAKKCAVIPHPVNNQFGNLCPICGEITPDAECRMDHDINTLKDICDTCGTEFESIGKLSQHRKYCIPVDEYFANTSRLTIAPSCSTGQILYNADKPIASFLPEIFAKMVQKGTLGTGQYQVMAALVDIDTSKEDIMKDVLTDSYFNLPLEENLDDISDWDDSINLAVLDMDDPLSEILAIDENLNEPKVSEVNSEPAKIEPPKIDQIQIFNNRESMEHTLIENRKLLCCGTCKMEVLDADSLVTHYLSHGNSTNFICQFCLRHYTRPYWFKVHLKTHAHQLPIVCPICDDYFLSTKLHEHHLQMVHHLSHADIAKLLKSLTDNQKNYYMCMECGRWLKSEKHLESHIKMHDMAKGRTVPLNDKETTTDQLVGKNNQASTTIVPTLTSNSTKRGKWKPIHIFECTICSVTIKSIEEVRQHLMSHAEHRLYKCEVCGERFPSAVRLQNHSCATNFHKCKECGKVFNHATGLACHLRTHSDHQAEAFSCDECQLKFKMLSAYLMHRARYH